MSEPTQSPRAETGDSLPSEPMQRVRIGLTGLAFVFLLVLVGTAILRSGDKGNSLPGAVFAPNDPIAEIGAAPSSAPENEATGKPDAPR